MILQMKLLSLSKYFYLVVFLLNFCNNLHSEDAVDIWKKNKELNINLSSGIRSQTPTQLSNEIGPTGKKERTVPTSCNKLKSGFRLDITMKTNGKAKITVKKIAPRQLRVRPIFNFIVLTSQSWNVESVRSLKQARRTQRKLRSHIQFLGADNHG